MSGLEAQAVFPCGLTCEPGGSGDVDRAKLVEGLSELLSKLRYLLLSDGSNGGERVLSLRSMEERGVRRCVRSHACAARWYASTKRPQS